MSINTHGEYLSSCSEEQGEQGQALERKASSNGNVYGQLGFN